MCLFLYKCHQKGKNNNIYTKTDKSSNYLAKIITQEEMLSFEKTWKIYIYI